MLKRYARKMTVVVLALCAVVSAGAPEVTEAQEAQSPGARAQQANTQAIAQNATTQKVVDPGDSLWAIGRERLPANPTDQQIVREVERIVEFNSDQLAPGSDLIYPGQVLSLPPVARPAPEAQSINRPQEQVARQPTGPSEAERAARPEPNPTGVVPVAESIELPKLPEAPSASDAILAGSSVETNVLGVDRKLLGVTIIFLTFVLGGLMVWKLPMRREIGDPWGLKTTNAYVNIHASSPYPNDYSVSRVPGSRKTAWTLKPDLPQRERRMDLRRQGASESTSEGPPLHQNGRLTTACGQELPLGAEERIEKDVKRP